MGKVKEASRKAAGVLFAAAIVAGGLAGCKSGTSAATGSGSAQKAVELSMIAPYSGQAPSTSSPVFQEIEKEANAKLNIQWTPMISYGDKYNVIMASNQLPNVLLVPDLKASTYVDAVKGSQFWQLDSYFSKYPNLKNISSIAITNSKTDGKLYCLPRERTIKRKDIIYRADWAKKAGLGAPDTIDKLYNMAKAFASADYDGNGQKDTIGLLLGTVADGGGTQIDCLNELVVANGGFNSWGVQSGKVVNAVETSEYMSTIDWLRGMYSEGLLSKDFPNTKTTSQSSDYMDKEKSGIMLGYGAMGVTDPVYLAQKKTNPNVKLSDIWGFTYLKDAKGNPRIPAETGYSGGFAFPKSSVKTEAQLKGILGVMDFLNSKNGQRLLNNGIQGRNYTLNSDGTATAIVNDANSNDIGSLNQLGMAGNYSLTVHSDALLDQLAKERITYKSSDLINDVSAPLSSDTYSTQYSNLSKIVDTAEFKYILGQIDKTQFEAAIKQWKSAGGDKMSQEFTASYKKAGGK